MVKHIVLWTIKEEFDKQSVFEEIKKIFEDFEQDVPGMYACKLYRAYDGYDVCLISEHEDRAAVAAYQNFPAHQKAKEIIAKYREDRASCDFEI
ncbi:Dabb family protein [Lachnospiraceae bacterium ZAX-1]